MDQVIRTELAEGVLRIEIDRPEKKNAFNAGVYRDLSEALAWSERDPRIRVLLLHGQTGIFSAGHEIQEFSASTPERAAQLDPIMAFMRQISGATKPIVAAVDGHAIGVGATLLLHCDLVYASHEACFQFPFVNLGLCPEFGSSYTLLRLAGHQRASELLMLGEFFSVELAREIGLVNDIVDASSLLEFAMARAHRLSLQPAASIRLTKQLLKAHDAEIVARTIEHEMTCFVGRTRAPEVAEAVAAFTERRKPDFSRFS
ncbi:enoyl-CoA hydratase [Castellaniella sp. GW247-6E4]|uniref:enoyl-CoA hydratase n=1 Tax=Castellaniella sp. GW247-6E4 TaxID=3140380 RepID=UPI0033163323